MRDRLLYYEDFVNEGIFNFKNDGEIKRIKKIAKVEFEVKLFIDSVTDAREPVQNRRGRDTANIALRFSRMLKGSLKNLKQAFVDYYNTSKEGTRTMLDLDALRKKMEGIKKKMEDDFNRFKKEVGTEKDRIKKDDVLKEVINLFDKAMKS